MFGRSKKIGCGIADPQDGPGFTGVAFGSSATARKFTAGESSARIANGNCKKQAQGDSTGITEIGNFRLLRARFGRFNKLQAYLHGMRACRTSAGKYFFRLFRARFWIMGS